MPSFHKGYDAEEIEIDMDFNISALFYPATFALIASTVFLIIRFIMYRMFRRWSKRTATQMDDITVRSLKTPSIFWALALGIYAGISLSDIPETYLRYINKSIIVIIIFSVTIALSNLSGRLFKRYIQRSNVPIPATGLGHGIVKGSILVIGLLIILAVLGISIAPLITALGIGGLAIALALQDSLANFFAGVHILVEKSVRVGDFIKLESDEKGYVMDITWRTTRVRMLPNNIVVIPNRKLAQSIVTNYYLPEKRMSLLIPVGVSYASDPEQVERILLEEAKKGTEEIPGLLKDYEPFVRFIPGFGDSALEFTLICQVREFVDQYLAQHELRKRIFKRFKQEGIDIPFPHRTVYLREEKDWKK